jgi:hypothetical protein
MPSPYNFEPRASVPSEWYWGRRQFWGSQQPNILADHPLVKRQAALEKAIRELSLDDARNAIHNLEWKAGVEVMLRAGLSVSVSRCGRSKFEQLAMLDIQRAIKAHGEEIARIQARFQVDSTTN